MTKLSEFPPYMIGQASELREKAYAFREKTRKANSLHLTFARMEEAANQGKMFVTFKLYEVPEDVLIDLQHLGYMVEYSFVQREANFITETFNDTNAEVTISWDE